jgi:integrase
MITDITLRNAKPKDKDYTINVDRGLSLLVKKTGGKLWRFRYTFNSKRSLISAGKYPQTTLRNARDVLQNYLDLLDQGINPSSHKKEKVEQKKAEKSFEDVAVEWLEKKYRGKNEKYRQITFARLENYIYPVIGDASIKSIKASTIYNLLEKIQQSGKVATGQKINSICSMIFKYGVAKGYCNRDVTQDYKGTLDTPRSKHLPTLTEPTDIAELLRDIQSYEGSFTVTTALKISPYVFLRPRELAVSKWEYIDFKKGLWIIPAEFMKMNRDHLVPISTQVRDLLESIYPVTGHGEYIFPSERSLEKTMHPESVNKAIRRIDNGKYIGRMVAHGFRGMASTILNESGKFRSDVIEKQLAHQEGNKVRGAYNHAEYLEERIEMMQWYADYLNDLKQ